MRGERIQIYEKLLQVLIYGKCVFNVCLKNDENINISLGGYEES